MNEAALLAPSRRERAAERKRQTIMAAGLELFAGLGLDGTCLDRVTKRADVSKKVRRADRSNPVAFQMWRRSKMQPRHEVRPCTTAPTMN